MGGIDNPRLAFGEMDYLSHITEESAAFAGALAGVDPDAQVPSCPGWDASDLAWHLTEVQLFWGSIVGDRLSAPDRAEAAKPGRPETLAATTELFSAATERLVAALEAAGPDEPVWTWYEGDQTVGFVLRRQAHEALIHRVDAQLTAGGEPTLHPDLAADGIDELLTVYLTGFPEWATFTADGETVRLRATDVDRRWGMCFGRMTGTSPNSGKRYDLDAVTVGEDAADPDLVLEGPAADLDLWLWGRGPGDEVRVAGSRELRGRLRDLVRESTQ